MCGRAIDDAFGSEARAVLETVVAIAREAGNIALEGFRRSLTIRSKARSDLVTDYDVRIERFVRDALGRALPAHGVVGEEAEGPQSRDRRFVWYVDPIDGTTNFAHGHPFFCISMGLAEHGEGAPRPIAGVVSAPALGLVYFAAEGWGAYRCREGAASERIAVSPTERLDDALLATGFAAEHSAAGDRCGSPSDNYARFVELDARSHGVRRCGAAALELCLVAEGAYDAFWDLGLKAWDIAAGAALVREAGGEVSGPSGGGALDIHAGAIVASNGRIHAELIDALGRLSSPRGGASARTRSRLEEGS